MADKPLSKKHIAFIDEYLACFNGTEAYSRIYPKATRESARALAALLLTNINVSAEISRRLDEVHMSADEALKRLAEIGRGDVTEFVDGFGSLDINALKESGKGHLVKKIKQTTIVNGKEDKETHNTEVELYPADSALRDILKMHGRYKENVDITSGNERLKVVIEYVESKTSEAASETDADQE